MIEGEYSGWSVILSSNTKRNYLSEVVIPAMCKGYERSKILYYFAFETDNKFVGNSRLNITDFGEFIESFLSEWAGTCATIISTMPSTSRRSFCPVSSGTGKKARRKETVKYLSYPITERSSLVSYGSCPDSPRRTIIQLIGVFS